MINALTEQNKQQKTRKGGFGARHIPYRDSKLTRLLQDSLGGNSVTMMVCNISPSESEASETASSLRFAERMARVKNKPVQGLDPAAEKLRELTKALKESQQENAKLKNLAEETRAQRGTSRDYLERLKANLERVMEAPPLERLRSAAATRAARKKPPPRKSIRRSTTAPPIFVEEAGEGGGEQKKFVAWAAPAPAAE